MTNDTRCKQNTSQSWNSRFVLVGICGWISCCLLIAGWLPEFSGNLQGIWLISGLLGLVSAVGLAEAIKSDMRMQEQVLGEYMKAAMTDALTGVANRHCLDLELEVALKNHSRSGTDLAMIMIDIDHFKAFNDQYGHPAGDAVLRSTTKKLKDFFGDSYLVARYGGEEFAVVLKKCSIADAVRLAETCRQAIKETICEFRGQKFHVTISCGVTAAAPTDSIDTITQRADMALYHAKRNGRDMIWVAESDQAGGNPESFPPAAELASLQTLAPNRQEALNV